MYAVVLVVSCSWAVLLSPSVYGYENLALKKKAWQNNPAVHIDVGSTRYYLGAGRAVDGLKQDLSWDGGHCVASLHGQTTVEWRVDLGDIFSIHHIVLQYVTGNVEWGVQNPYAKNFLGFSVFISNTTKKQDGVLCFYDTNYTRATIPNPVNITCPYHGRYVIYFNSRTYKPYPDGYSFYAYNDLCEVEVYGCPSPGYYGEKCNLKCPLNCHERHCHITNGTCLGCLERYNGEYCSIPCPKNCQERRCHITKGICLGCLQGYYGEFCSLPCPQNCQKDRCHITEGSCLGCLPGYYGATCSLVCPQNCLERRCHATNGTCLGCERGYLGSRCKQRCPDGLYGYNCAFKCSLDCEDPPNCDKITGNCYDLWCESTRFESKSLKYSYFIVNRS
uniref:Uncharacterized protein LOC111113067 n=1 Tax=Crassostrea virginica TaxID=6565 RepID=A0A8B8BV27_CRAVI|nr:uncharacterized protein LOC111113067 [Crassostrea virginica]